MSGAMNWTCRTLGVTALTALAACGSGSSTGPGLGDALRETARGLTQRGNGGAAPAAPTDPQAMAAEALQVNPGPLIMVGLESQGTTQVMALTGENQGKRTYMTESMEGMILRDGLVLGTRGLGNDMSVTEAGTEPLIRGNRSGSAQRIIRVWNGEGLEQPIAFSCTVAPEGGRSVERCSAGAVTFENRYLVGPGGSLPVSRQWLGPGLGYVTVQVLRP